ncbi:hypothetical protein LCGC14_1824630, partial [marine sediment metagenome]
DQKDALQGVSSNDSTDKTIAAPHKTVTRLMCFDIYDIDGDGRKDLLMGNTAGELLFYAHVGTDPIPAFHGFEPVAAGGTPIDLPETPRSRPSVADYNNDGIPDILVGAADGLVRLYVGQSEPVPGGSVNVNDGEPGGMYVYSFHVQHRAGIKVEPTSRLTTNEDGLTAPYTVVLQSQPTHEVTIAINSSDTTEGTVSTSSVTFTPNDWDQPQTVIVTGVDDEATDGHTLYTVFADPAVSDDPDYSGMETTAISLVNRDNEPAEIVGRHIFYNNSVWDGNDTAINESDDDAIALDKEALLPGITASFENYTSYSRGINGIVIDVLSLAGEPTINDFQFLVGNNSDPDGWVPAPQPELIEMRERAGDDETDRVMIVWSDNAIEKQWLQVTVKANENTGLAKPDIFYFGSAPGEAGNNSVNTIVNATDEIAARNFQHSAVDKALIDDPYDYNRDSLVDGTDQIIARENQTNPLTMLRLITAPAVDAVIEQASVEEIPDTGVSSAEWNWLYEVDRMNSKNQTTKKDDSREATVDLLLATDWA